MRRVVSLCFPHLSAELARRRARLARFPLPPGPLVVSSHDGRRLAIGGTDPAAAALGLRAGLPIGEAQARVPGLLVVPAEPARDAADLARLARLCLRYAPHVAPDPPDGVLVDATGCAHLFGGERRMLAGIVDRFVRLGLTCRGALAGTVGAAHAVARFGALEPRTRTPSDAEPGPTGGSAIVRPGTEAESLGALPPEALRLDPALCASLRALGLDRIASLSALPRAPLARRFGTAPGRRLDQALGGRDEPVRPVAPPRPIASRLGFVEPLATADAFEAAIGRLLGEVHALLDAAGRGARRLELAFERVDGTVQVVRVATARPVRDPHRLARLLGERLETVDPGLGVEAMRLLVRVHEPLPPSQTEARAGEEDDGDADGPARLSPLIDTLVNRLGPGRVWRAGAVQSDVPERSVARLAPLAPPPGPGNARDRTSRSATGRSATGWSATGRPVRLIDPPQPVEVMALLPDHPPASFTWRRIRHRVRHADGPERIAGEWWRSPREVRALRDYFRIEDEHGQRFWLFRRGDGVDPETGDMRWFLHGLF